MQLLGFSRSYWVLGSCLRLQQVRAGTSIIQEKGYMKMEKLINLITLSLLISNFAKSEGSNVDSKLDWIYFTFLSSCFGPVVVILNERSRRAC